MAEDHRGARMAAGIAEQPEALARLLQPEQLGAQRASRESSAPGHRGSS